MKLHRSVNRSTIILAVAVMLKTSAITCSARLGETFDECQARYGLLGKVENGTRADYPQYCFQKDGIEIRIRFLNGRSAQETFTGIAGKISDLAIAEILNANAQGSTWSSTGVGHAKAYTRQDTKAVAQYTGAKKAKGRNALNIETTEFVHIFKAPGTEF